MAHQVQFLARMVEQQMVVEVPSKDWHLVVPATFAVTKSHYVKGDGLGSHLRPHGARATLLCSSGTTAEVACRDGCSRQQSPLGGGADNNPRGGG